MVGYYFENVVCIFYYFSLKVNESTYSFKLYGMHQCSTQSFLGVLEWNWKAATIVGGPVRIWSIYIVLKCTSQPGQVFLKTLF